MVCSSIDDIATLAWGSRVQLEILSRIPHLFSSSGRPWPFTSSPFATLSERVCGTVRHIRDEIETLSGSNWRILTSGEHVCAIVFEADVELGQLICTLRNTEATTFNFS